MIKLIAKPVPSQLTPELIQELTDKFKQNKNARVWAQDFIKDTLLQMSNNKCCYCECEINVAGSDFHVEHFHPKDIYKDEVVLWDNLLPSCGRCNRHKSTLDTRIKPIIHPIRNEPKNHLEFRSNFLLLVGKDDLGEFTIDRLELNDDERLSVDRYRLAFSVNKSLDKLLKDINEILSNKTYLTENKKTRFSRELRTIMELGTAERKYSAVISSVILINTHYQEIKQLFITQQLWNDDFIELEQQVNDCALL